MNLQDTLPFDGDLDATFGVLFIGFMFASAFYGCAFFQCYVFYTRYPSEHAYTKGVVGLLCSADTVVTGLLSHTMYEYLINNFTISFDSLNVLRTFITALALTNSEMLLVQLFYAYRTWILSERRPAIPVLIAAISFASFALAISAAVQMSKQLLFVDIITSNVELLAGLSAGLSTLCNILIVSTQYFFLQPKRQPGRKIQEGWFDIGVLHILSRGTLFMIVQLALLLTYVIIPRQYVWLCFHILIGKVYTNCLLAMLNSRSPYRGRGLNEEENLNTRSRSTGVSASQTASPSQFPNPGSPLNISSKGGRSMTMELDVVPSRSDIGGDYTSKSIMGDDDFDSTPELSHKKSKSIAGNSTTA